MITLDDTDQEYVSAVLSKCIAIVGMRMTDTNVCEANRELAREIHKMAVKARDIVNETKSEVNG